MNKTENFKFLEPIQRGKKGLWCQRLAYKDKYGKWKQTSKSGFAHKRDITTAVKNEMLKELSSLLSLDNSMDSITLKDFSELVIADKKNEYALNTILAYRHAINRLPTLGNMPIKEITYAHCIKELATLEQAKENTVSSTVTVLKTFFKQAMLYKVIPSNPLADYSYKMSQKENSRLRIFTEEEMNTLLDFYKGKDPQTWIQLCFLRYCGLRLNEMNGLRWCSIQGNMLTVDRQYSNIDGKFAFRKLKTKNSYRTIPMPNTLVNAIHVYKKKYPPFISTARIVQRNIALNASIKKIYPCHSPHDFRHTYATNLLARGVDLRTVASLLGDTITTVEKTYIHYSEEMRKNAVIKLNEIFG
ncbi:hypothetical protein C3L57_07065 [Veillonellaceae bacterium M2-8]|nr:hypothetical protein [Veillonellaceae bacterium M2-8]